MLYIYNNDLSERNWNYLIILSTIFSSESEPNNFSNNDIDSDDELDQKMSPTQLQENN